MRSIDTLRVSEVAHEQLCHVMEDAEYDPAAAARESESGLFLDLHQLLRKLRHHLEAGDLICSSIGMLYHSIKD